MPALTISALEGKETAWETALQDPRAQSYLAFASGLALPLTWACWKVCFCTTVPWFLSFKWGSCTNDWNSMEAASIWAPPRCQALCQALGIGRDEMMWSLLSQASQGRTMWWVFRKGKCRLLWEHVAIGFTLTEGERGASFLSKSDIEVKSLKLFRGESKGWGWGKHSSLREENVQRPWDGEEDWMKSQMAEMLEKC